MRYIQSNTSIGGWFLEFVAKSLSILAIILLLASGCTPMSKGEITFRIEGIISCNTKPEAKRLLGEITTNVYRAIKRPFESCKYISGIVVVHERVTNSSFPGWVGSDGSRWILLRVTVTNKTGVFEDLFILTPFYPLKRTISVKWNLRVPKGIAE